MQTHPISLENKILEDPQLKQSLKTKQSTANNHVKNQSLRHVPCRRLVAIMTNCPQGCWLSVTADDPQYFSSCHWAVHASDPVLLASSDWAPQGLDEIPEQQHPTGAPQEPALLVSALKLMVLLRWSFLQLKKEGKKPSVSICWKWCGRMSIFFFYLMQVFYSGNISAVPCPSPAVWSSSWFGAAIVSSGSEVIFSISSKLFRSSGLPLRLKDKSKTSQNNIGYTVLTFKQFFDFRVPDAHDSFSVLFSDLTP